MITSISFRPRRAAHVLLLVPLLTFTAVGCGDAPPAGHADRIEKAAGVASFRITCTRDMWARTSHPEYGRESFDQAKPHKLAGERAQRGLVEVTLTGTQLVDYLKQLERDIGGGWNANSDDEPMARRMYAAIAPVVDRIQAGVQPTELPEAVVDDAAVPAGPARPSGAPHR
ncbi:hypothetical protein [Streptomyces sp. AM 2-1-1]|uniref:hypothetical protein n=1 Tax=Streptomyces sp. AM 2-1-1 TaxID=3028709 RepID=UPI0023B88860|nr:hypothetical protein [Streptomyces sp. AM 2-1-1]WEH43997.1 hypothetical protein PZB77_31020 [Streptomyces sp. AM 2-1-1]